MRRSDGLIRLAPNLEWHDVSFGGIVLAALGLDVPVSLANDADLGALAEHRRGVGVGVDDLIYISGNVGVGAGIITGGVRLEGAGGYAGEIGHLRFNPAGKPCHCGNAAAGRPRSVRTRSPRPLVPRVRVAQLGEVLAATPRRPRSCARIGWRLGQGLASHRQRVQPPLVVLGGYLGAAVALVQRRGRQPGLAERALPACLESVTLSLPGLGGDSVLLGAAEIAFEPLFVDPVAALGAALVDVRSRLAG